MDEATQFSERAFNFLGGCLRGTNDIPKRFYVTCNPGELCPTPYRDAWWDQYVVKIEEKTLES